MNLPDLTDDCAACAALCCVALAFDKGESFALSKPAGIACPNLRRQRCSIHQSLEDKGFSGCAAYRCNGAGQRTLTLFDGRSWQDDPALLAPQMVCFRALRQLHEVCELLIAAATLPLPPIAEAERLAFLAALCPTQMTPEKAGRLAAGPLADQVRRFLGTLGAYVPLRRPA